MRSSLIPSKATLPADVTTEVDLHTPWYLRIANVVIPSFIIGPAVLALLVKLGIFSSAALLFSSAPFGIAVLAAIGTAALVAWLGPILIGVLNPERKNKHSAADQSKRELTRRFSEPSAIRSFDWTTRATMAATGFALLAVVIAFFILNPPGAIVGTAVIELIQFSAVPLTIAAGVGASFGLMAAALWRRFALQYALRHRPTKTMPSVVMPGQIHKDSTIDDSQLKAKNLAPQRKWYLASIHEAPLLFRLAFGMLLGVSIATAISLTIMPSGGLAALMFAGVSLGTAALAIAYPYIGQALERTFGFSNRFAEKNLVPAAHTKDRFWFEQSSLDIPIYVQLFLGMGAGFAIGGLLGGTALFIAPFVGAAAFVILPKLFAAIEKSRFVQRLQNSSALFAKTPHGHNTLDMPWTARLFNGAGAAAAFCVSMIALGVAPHLALGIAMALPVIAVLSPALAAFRRAYIPLPRALEQWLFSPTIQSDHNNGTELKQNKFLIYTQWYVRVAVGAMVGGLLALGFGFLANPIIAPTVTIGMAVFFLVAQPIYKGLQTAFKQRDTGMQQMPTVPAGESAPGVTSAVNPLAALAGSATAESWRGNRSTTRSCREWFGSFFPTAGYGRVATAEPGGTVRVNPVLAAGVGTAPTADGGGRGSLGRTSSPPPRV